jgi:hypothetical protein
MTMWRQKSNDEGKKERSKGRAEKNSLIASRGLKSRVHRHTLLEECAGRDVFSSLVPGIETAMMEMVSSNFY